MKPAHTLTKSAQVGIYENRAYIARVYGDKIIVTAPYVRWEGGSGNYAERKVSVRDPVAVAAITREIADNATDTAWSLIGGAIGDDYLIRA